MGRHYFSTKTEADNLLKIDLSWLKKQNILQSSCSTQIAWANEYAENENNIGIDVAISNSEKYIRLYYIQTERNGEQKDFNYRIPIISTSCHYGGKRYWFICPWHKNGVYCGKRVRVLYKAGDYFACRHCYNLTYRTRNENRRHRIPPLFNGLIIERKIEKLQEKIKKPFYAKKPTKKQKKLEQLYQQASMNFSCIEAENLL